MQHVATRPITDRLGRVLGSAPILLTTRMIYYLAVLLGLLVLYGKGDFSTAGFIYQAF